MIEFSEKFSTPHFLLTLSEEVCEFRNSKDLASAELILFSAADKTLSVEFSGFIPRPAVVDNENAVVIVLGSPIYNNVKVDQSRTAMALLENFSTKTVLELIDGEFLAVYFDKKDGALKFINDRWCSIPLHYHLSKQNKIFSASPCFSSLWRFLKKSNLLKFNQEAIFEFLWFQRIFGTKTLAKDTFFMPDAHFLNLKGWNLKMERYWQRNYTKNENSLDDNARILADMVKSSISLKTADGKRYGHFLSGGMDSRSVLAAFKGDPPSCFTVGVSDNREVKTARKLAEAKNARHNFFRLDPEHYGRIRKVAVKICGGMYNYDHALFLGYQDAVRAQADVCFNGYGFDFMFQGMYIPGKNVKFIGRNLNYWIINEPPDDLVNYFINNASYRVKNADILAFLKETERRKLKEFLHESIKQISDQGKQITNDKFDLWEYLTFHHLSRHYSYPNVLSIKTFAEARVISFTNQIFDFYLSLPIEHRFDGKIEKRLLQILDERLAKIPSANTGMPITAGRFERTFCQVSNAVKRRLLGQKDFESWTERTWPSREYAIRKQLSLKNAVLDIVQSDVLEQIEFLDMKKIRNDLPKYLEGENVSGISGDLVQAITTLGTFLVA